VKVFEFANIMTPASVFADPAITLYCFYIVYCIVLHCTALQIKEEPPIYAPASVFADPAIANLLFKTKNCLRLDKSTCFDASE
jgi:hypothetical protein